MTATNDTRKLYQAVAEAITRDIAAGRSLPGQKLPSERELTELHDVSRPTIREAMIALEIRGIVEARRPPKMNALMGTPLGSSHAGSIVGHCDAGAVKREFG